MRGAHDLLGGPAGAVGILPAARLVDDLAVAIRKGFGRALEEAEAVEEMDIVRSPGSAGVRGVAARVEPPVQRDAGGEVGAAPPEEGVGAAEEGEALADQHAAGEGPVGRHGARSSRSRRRPGAAGTASASA